MEQSEEDKKFWDDLVDGMVEVLEEFDRQFPVKEKVNSKEQKKCQMED